MNAHIQQTADTILQLVITKKVELLIHSRRTLLDLLHEADELRRSEVSSVRVGASAVIFDRGDHLELANLVVHESCRNNGIGTKTVRRVMSLGRPIRLEAVPYEGCRRKLHQFYKRLGFASTRRGRRTFFEWRPGNADLRQDAGNAASNAK